MSFFSKIGEKTSEAFSNVLSSHSALENTGLVFTAITSPSTLGFGVFFQSILESLKDPVECEEAKLSKEELKYYAMLATLANEVYNPKEKRKLPPEAGDMIFEENSNGVDRTPYIVLNSNELDKIFVVIRGSYTYADFITDLKASADDIDGTLIHSGVYSASNSLFIRSEGLLLQTSKENGNRQIVFTGHSLGSGVASCTARMFKKAHPELDIKAVAFAPVASMSGDAIEETKSYITTFALGGDPIPFLSLHNVAQVSQKGLPKVVNQIIQDAVSRDISLPVSLPEDFDIESNPFEKPPPTLEQIKKDLETVTRRTTALYPAGKAYHIVLEGTTFKKVRLDDIKDNIEYFGCFRKGVDETHHSMDLYNDCIHELYERAN